jgi:putative transposase
MTIKKEGNEYYAIFTSTKQEAISQIKDDNPVGIDLGLRSFIALSDGKKIEKPKFFKKRERRIARWQRIVSRRKKGSNRRQIAKERLQNEWKGITNQSNDFMHKLSDNLVKIGYTSFAVEKLNIQNMTKNHRLAQSITNASWNGFIQFLSYKAESAGMEVKEVDAKYTSKTCNNCGNIKDMPLSERTYNCIRCGLHMDRDVNAAINILNRATLGQRGSYAQGDIIRPQHEAVLKELGTNPAYAGEANEL